MRALAAFALLALAACGSEQPRDTEETAGSPADQLSGDWRDLFGVMMGPAEIDGAQWESLHQCPDQPDLPKFMRELWPLWLAKRDAVEALPGPWPTDVLSDDIEAPMLAHIEAAGCTRFTGTVSAVEVLASAAIREPDLYKNTERWIAFRTAGQSGGFYLVQNPTVD